MTQSNDLTGFFQHGFGEIQNRARDAYARGAELAGECTGYVRGNAEALLQSGKALSDGVHAISNDMLTETRTAIEELTDDLLSLTSAATPADLFAIQTDIASKTMVSAIAFTSKRADDTLKLANDMIAPLTGRMAHTINKIGSAAAG